MLYRIKRVHVEAGGTAEMVITYPHESSELYYLAIPDDMSSFTSGSVSSGIAAGKILKTGEQRYSFKGAYVGGYTVFIGRKSQIKTTASQKPGAAFPLASILQVLSELSRISEEHSEETERSMRSPEAEGKMILPTAELRAGLILGFDEHGNPVVGKQIPQVADILTQEIRVEEHVLRAQDAAAQAKNSEKLAQLFADDAGNSKKEAETWAEEAAKHSGDAQSVIGDVRSEGANALNALGSEKDKALSEISGKAITAVEQAQKAAADAQEDREAVEQMYNAAAGSNEELQKALCFMACSVRTIEAWKNAVEAWKNATEQGADEAEAAVAAVRVLMANAETLSATATELSNKLSTLVTSAQLGTLLLDYVLKTQVATINTAGLIKLGTATDLTGDNAGVVGATSGGQLMVPNATTAQKGCVRLAGSIDDAGGVAVLTAKQVKGLMAGWGISILPKGVSVSVKEEHSGLDFDGDTRRMFVNVANRETHPTAGTVAPTATDTAGKLVVTNATTSLPGGVKLASGVDDTGDVAVLTAAQIKTLLAGKMNMADAVSLTLSIQQLEARVAALEGATTA